MNKLATVMLIAYLPLASVAFGGRAAEAFSSAYPTGVHLAASVDGGPQTIFLKDGRTIQAEGTQTLGNRTRVETPTGRIDLPSSEVLSIHPMNSPATSPSGPPPVDVYRGLTQQMTDRVRGQLQEQANPPQIK
jgi:hypothetical protein